MPTQGILLGVENDRSCYSTKCAQINLNLQSSINTIKGKIFILQPKSGRERQRGEGIKWFIIENVQINRGAKGPIGCC